jgi:hypothetical protein
LGAVIAHKLQQRAQISLAEPSDRL